MAPSGLDLFVAGAGPAYSDRPGALGSSYVVRSRGGGRPIVLDLGQGTLPNVFRVARPEAVACVLLTHLHPDHWVDLVPLRHYLRWELDGRASVRVVAPSGLEERLDTISGEPDFCGSILAVEPLAAGRVGTDGSGLVVEARRVTHRGEAYAFRVATGTDGPGLVYTGDCGRPGDLDPLVRAGDTLLAEVSFGTGPPPVPDIHLDATAVAGLASRTRAARVVLTHLQMGYDRGRTVEMVRAGFDGPVEIVEPGDRLDVDSA